LVFRGVGKSDISSFIEKANVFLCSSEVDEVPFWQFARHFSNDMDKFTMDRVMRTLEASKIATVINRPGGDSYIKVHVTKKEIVQKMNELNADDSHKPS